MMMATAFMIDGKMQNKGVCAKKLGEDKKGVRDKKGVKGQKRRDKERCLRQEAWRRRKMK